ncbi:MAG TPA: DUF2703 domain-containing protein [Bacillota bacterium]|nr:DUF2703 domain-containing protein [Bacillota bacterium]
MARTWYPVIDYGKCTECGSCVAQCPHGVFDKVKAPTPVVDRPGRCIDHCHGCGNRCPAGAITYVGDDTGWLPPNVQKPGTDTYGACCSTGAASKEISVEYLYLDLETCDRCIGTGSILDEVVDVLSPALKLAGYSVKYQKTKIGTPEQAERCRFFSSPTIRVNGQDVCSELKEDSCDCCSDISGDKVDCRLFTHGSEGYEVPPREILAEAILRSIFGPAIKSCSCSDEYKLPENLRVFFEGVKKRGK